MGAPPFLFVAGQRLTPRSVLCIMLIVLELDIGHRQQVLSGAKVANSRQPAEVGNSEVPFGGV